MKNVFTNSDLAKAWFAQLQPEGRNANNSFSFQGRELISYNTAIAYLVSPQLIITTSRRHSNTTAKQLGHARRASNYITNISVDLGERGTRNWNSLKIVLNIPKWVEELEKRIQETSEKKAMRRSEAYANFDQQNIDDCRKSIAVLWQLVKDLTVEAEKQYADKVT